MRFESEMIAPLREYLEGHWKDGWVFEEFGVGYGIADLIAVRPSRRGIRQRKRLGQTVALARRPEIQVLRALLECQVASFEDLLGSTGISPGQLRYKILRFLRTENYVEEVERGVFQLRSEYHPVAQEIWAVEAKMKNWFEGVCQARRYQHFAHRVYLAIFAPHRDRVRDEILHEHNLGLISVEAGSAKIVFHPKRTEPRNEELLFLSNERIWAQIHTAQAGA